MNLVVVTDPVRELTEGGQAETVMLIKAAASVDASFGAALTRKNALFAGSDGGAKHWAAIASLIETCKLNEVEPFAYLADVITRIVQGHPQSRLDELLPWTYAAAPDLKAVA